MGRPMKGDREANPAEVHEAPDRFGGGVSTAPQKYGLQNRQTSAARTR